MKKKIIYISGADSFDVADVRAAFEEVRTTLKLDQDVLLFGVPVDNFESVPVADVATTTDSAAIDSNVQETEDVASQEVIEPEEIEEIPVKKPKKSRKKAESQIVEDTPAEIIESSDSDEDTSILSVLATNQPVMEEETEEIEDEVEDVVDEDETDTIEDESEPEEVTEDESEEAIEETMEEIVEDVDEAAVEEEPELDDMLSDDMPTEASEKTLEELLESMTPLREDIHDDTPKANTKKQDDEIDATLEHLASEFAENQDKVPSPKKSSERGKIGKLKNILPFKKIKRDDSGIMGDLFGWAGIAANDEDFTIPGFFTNAASKK